MANRLARRVIAVSLAWGLLARFELAAQAPSNAPQNADRATHAEELIAEKAPSCDAVDDEDVVSDDGRKLAWRCRANDKWTVQVNGVSQGGTFDQVRSLTFSLDSQHVAFAARSDKRWVVVGDGTARPGTYADVGAPFTATTAGGWRLVRSRRKVGAGRRRSTAAGRVRRARGQDLQPGRSTRRVCRPPGEQVHRGRRRQGGTALRHCRRLPLQFRQPAVRLCGGGCESGLRKQKAVSRVVIDGAAGLPIEGPQIGSLLKNR